MRFVKSCVEALMLTLDPSYNNRIVLNPFTLGAKSFRG
jgi:hypothetical protein